MADEPARQILARREDIQRCIEQAPTLGLRVQHDLNGEKELVPVFELHSPAEHLRRRVAVKLDEARRQFRWTFLWGERGQPPWDGKWAHSSDVVAVPENACSQLIDALRNWREGQPEPF